MNNNSTIDQHIANLQKNGIPEIGSDKHPEVDPQAYMDAVNFAIEEIQTRHAITWVAKWTGEELRRNLHYPMSALQRWLSNNDSNLFNLTYILSLIYEKETKFYLADQPHSVLNKYNAFPDITKLINNRYVNY